MEIRELIISSIEFIYSIFLGLMVVFFSFKIFLKVIKIDNEEKELVQNKNIALSISLVSVLITVGMIIKNLLIPTFSLMKVFLENRVFEFEEIFSFILFFLGLFIFCSLIAIGSISLSALIFKKMSNKLKEIEELKKNNIAIAILFSGVILIIGYFVSEGANSILKNIIPTNGFPTIIQFR